MAPKSSGGSRASGRGVPGGPNCLRSAQEFLTMPTFSRDTPTFSSRKIVATVIVEIFNVLKHCVVFMVMNINSFYSSNKWYAMILSTPQEPSRWACHVISEELSPASILQQLLSRSNIISDNFQHLKTQTNWQTKRKQFSWGIYLRSPRMWLMSP